MKVSEYRSIDRTAQAARDFFIGGGASYRVTTKVWRYMLLKRMEEIVVNCCPDVLEAKSLGAGVYELRRKSEKPK